MIAPEKLPCPLLPLLWVLSLWASAPAQEPCAYEFPLDSNPTSITPQDICNFHQVDETLYRGGRPRTRAFPKLVELGVRTIISLEEPESAAKEKATVDELNRTLAPEQQIDFLSFPISPAETEETGVSHERLQELFRKMRGAQRPIFLHCYHGKDRTGAIVALYRMLMNQKSAREAYEEAYHYRFSRDDHGLSRMLNRYARTKKLQTLPRPGPPTETAPVDHAGQSGASLAE